MPKQVLGLELGNHHLALVQLTGTAKAYEITAAIHHPLPGLSDLENWHLQVQQALTELLDTHQLRADTVLAALPASQMVLRNLELPFRDTRRIRQVLAYTLDEHMPYDPEDIVADFAVLPGAPESGVPILAAAVPQELIASTLDLLQELNLDPMLIDCDVFGLANAALLGAPTPPANTILVDIQSDRTLITMLSHGTPVFARSWAFGWPQGDMPIEVFGPRLSKQLQHMVYAYENVFKQPYDAELLQLSGASQGHLSALADVLHTMLDIPAELWQVTAEACRTEPETPEFQDDQSLTAVAFGTALRGLYRQTVGLDLRQGQFALHHDLQQLRGRLVVVGCLLVLLAGMGIGSLYLNNHYKLQRLNQIQGNIAQVFRTTLPDSRMVQPALQMQEKVREISDRLRAFGGVTGAQLSGLQILREISDRVPDELTLNVDTLTITSNAVDIGGTTGSYDDVVKLKGALEASPAIGSAKIISAKDEQNKVAFKLNITLAQTLENLS